DGVAVGRGAGGDRAAPNCSVTTSTPAMPTLPLPPWNWQKYGKVPALAKVCLKLAPFSSLPLSNEPSSAVAVCDLWPLCVQTTVAPTGTVILFGEKLLSAISIATSCGAAAGAAAWAGAGTAAAVAGASGTPAISWAC